MRKLESNGAFGTRQTSPVDCCISPKKYQMNSSTSARFDASTSVKFDVGIEHTVKTSFEPRALKKTCELWWREYGKLQDW